MTRQSKGGHCWVIRILWWVRLSNQKWRIPSPKPNQESRTVVKLSWLSWSYTRILIGWWIASLILRWSRSLVATVGSDLDRLRIRLVDRTRVSKLKVVTLLHVVLWYFQNSKDQLKQPQIKQRGPHSCYKVLDSLATFKTVLTSRRLGHTFSVIFRRICELAFQLYIYELGCKDF